MTVSYTACFISLFAAAAFPGSHQQFETVAFQHGLPIPAGLSQQVYLIHRSSTLIFFLQLHLYSKINVIIYNITELLPALTNKCSILCIAMHRRVQKA